MTTTKTAINLSIVADYPAYTVVDLGQEVITVSRETVKSLHFCFARQTRNHGILHSEYSLSGVAAYAAQYGHDEEVAVERAKARGENLFWLNPRGCSITSHQRPKEIWIRLQPGQRIRFDGVLLEVVHLRHEFYNLEIVNE